MTLGGPVLVTGITGQDGGYLAEQLRERRVEVHGLIRRGESIPGYLPDGLHFHEVELADEKGLAHVFDLVAPAAVFNLAGVSSVAGSWSKPAETVLVNAHLVARLLELLERRPGTRLVQASSAEIFAGCGEPRQNEDSLIAPINPYGVSKACAHLLVQAYRRRGVHASNAILFNHESPRRPAAFVTRRITQGVAAIVRGEAEVLTLGNLGARRDWGWAPDYTEAMLRMAELQTPGDFVIATGESRSVEDFVAAAFAAVGIADWRCRVVNDAALVRVADAPELVGDSSRARRSLGWRPSLTFEEIVARMVAADLDELSAQA